MKTIPSSDYLLEQRREYSLYTLYSRAIPFASDGLKAAARRVLWVAKDGKKYKSATLAGMTMPIHPHQSPEGTINTLAAPYTNNIPLFTGIGSFGTLMKPLAYGASRYTSVTVSTFTKEVIYRDIELVPMKDNYDSTLTEPKHFLPLIPIALLNPQKGIAVGFAADTLPRALSDILQHQILHLKGQTEKVTDPFPSLECIDQTAISSVTDKKDHKKWIFRGTYDKINATTLVITGLPYGTSHEKYVQKLYTLEDNKTITNIVDNSSDHYNIKVKFKKGTLTKLSEQEILKLIFLETSVGENLNVIDFDETSVWSTTYVELLTDFTDWRLSWYIQRYNRLKSLILVDIQRYNDILLAIRKNISGAAKSVQNRSELKELLSAYGIVYIEYIADLPVYRFTSEEKLKIERKLSEATILLNEYQLLIDSDDARRDKYIAELREIQRKNKKGLFNV